MWFNNMDSHPAGCADIVILTTKGTAAEETLNLAGKGNLSGKIVIDTTNPISDEPPINGVLKFFTDLDRSLPETLQETTACIIRQGI